MLCAASDVASGTFRACTVTTVPPATGPLVGCKWVTCMSATTRSVGAPSAAVAGLVYTPPTDAPLTRATDTGCSPTGSAGTTQETESAAPTVAGTPCTGPCGPKKQATSPSPTSSEPLSPPRVGNRPSPDTEMVTPPAGVEIAGATSTKVGWRVNVNNRSDGDTAAPSRTLRTTSTASCCDDGGDTHSTCMSERTVTADGAPTPPKSHTSPQWCENPTPWSTTTVPPSVGPNVG